MADDTERAERQARLSKALSAAYLSHQITQLEDRVSGIALDGTHGNGRGRGRARRPGRGRGGGVAVQRTVEVRSPSPVKESAMETRLVVDTSALLFALPHITHLLRSGKGELVVPLETLRTLDLLKKGMHPYAVAARTATRFVETEQRRTGARKDDIVGADGWRKIRPGLWIQREHEQEHIGPSEHREPVTDEATSPPPFIQSTLACALYFRKFWDLTSSQPVLAVAVPSSGEVPPEDPVARYAERADGRALREWADRGDVVVRLLGQRDEPDPEDAQDTVKNGDPGAIHSEEDRDSLDVVKEDRFLDQEEARIMTLTSPSDDPRARPSRRAPPPAVRATPTTGDRVPKIFDAEKGMVPSTEVLAQREREREREVRGARRGGRGRGAGRVFAPQSGWDESNRRPANAPTPPVILQRSQTADHARGDGGGRGIPPRRARGGGRVARVGRVEGIEAQTPPVMLLQRPK